MNERCPLRPNVNHWSQDVPAVCRESCEADWEAAVNTQAPEIDTFTTKCDDGLQCNHDIEVSDVVLQRSDGPKRMYGILNVCANGGTELFAEEFTFLCRKS